MPIFQEDLERRESGDEETMASPPRPLVNRQPNQPGNQLRRRLSEESISTELCEGLILDNPQPKPSTPDFESATTCSDRAELIERLKRGESPTWVPNRHLESLWNPQHPRSPTRSPKPAADSPMLLPAPTLTPEKRDGEADDEARLREGLNIERPRSALHSGDFTEDQSSREESTANREHADDRDLREYRTTSQTWIATSPPRDFTPFHFQRQESSASRSEGLRLGTSLSSSVSSSFVYKPPTSPLVQSEINEDFGFSSPVEGIDINSNFPRSTRRHTLFSPHSGSYGFSSPGSYQRQPPSFRQERTYPYQAHQPRRSLTSTPNFSLDGHYPQTPALLRSRRPSYSSDTSPLQHASMVGSYEESILRGRMSTTPSKPLDFVAQIGVLGLGKCKASLRCPSHVTLPFPAVFYSYASSFHGRSKVEDGPSPYVGLVDLENGLPHQEEESRSRRKMQSRAAEQRRAADDRGGQEETHAAEPSEREPRKTQRSKRRSGSPRAPPGGSYRIPEKGQIQIVIKNPNKTAVKLFLVPYDLAGMEPGTKTFVRQRSYSAGPIIDNVPELNEIGTAERPVLRYLVHLHICCPSRGRYYLYKSIRVVFANRVPDGKERLRNEITLPEPRFTPYKPIRVMHPPTMGGTGPGANLTADKAFRRRSSGFYFGASSQAFDAVDGFASQPAVPHQTFSFGSIGSHLPVEPIPFRVSANGAHSILENSHSMAPMLVTSPDSSQTSRPLTQDSSNVSSWGAQDGSIDRYDKLSKGDVGYGGNPFAPSVNGSPGTAEGLLSRRLRSLGVQPQHKSPEMED